MARESFGVILSMFLTHSNVYVASKHGSAHGEGFPVAKFCATPKASQGGFHVMISEWRSEVHF